MSNEFADCLSRGKIKEFSPGPKLCRKELALAVSDLGDARRSNGAGSHKWAIVQCYYAMFHAARAVLYASGYREKSHYCLVQSIRHLYVRTGRLDASFIEDLVAAKNLREEADYYGDFSRSNCEKFLVKAERFIAEAEIILNAKKA